MIVKLFEKPKRKGDKIIFDGVDISWDLAIAEETKMTAREIAAGTYYAKLAGYRRYLNDPLDPKAKYFIACSVGRILTDSEILQVTGEISKYDFLYWVNYGDHSVYGWFTVEQIQRWLSNCRVLLADIGGTDERESRTDQLRQFKLEKFGIEENLDEEDEKKSFIGRLISIFN